MELSTFADCMDVFDHLDSDLFEYLYHVSVSKVDAGERILRVLPHLISHANGLIDANNAAGDAYEFNFQSHLA